jgi:hypothetical protein
LKHSHSSISRVDGSGIFRLRAAGASRVQMTHITERDYAGGFLVGIQGGTDGRRLQGAGAQARHC